LGTDATVLVTPIAERKWCGGRERTAFLEHSQEAETMKALTICQPYAELIMCGEKLVENRVWKTDYRGPLLIHAGKSLDYLKRERLKPADYVLGAIVGVAVLADCASKHDTRPGRGFSAMVLKRHPWLATHVHAEGPCCLILANVQRFAEPITYVGKQSLFVVTDDVVAEALKAVGYA